MTAFCWDSVKLDEGAPEFPPLPDPELALLDPELLGGGEFVELLVLTEQPAAAAAMMITMIPHAQYRFLRSGLRFG